MDNTDLSRLLAKIESSDRKLTPDEKWLVQLYRQLPKNKKTKARRAIADLVRLIGAEK